MMNTKQKRVVNNTLKSGKCWIIQSTTKIQANKKSSFSQKGSKFQQEKCKSQHEKNSKSYQLKDSSYNGVLWLLKLPCFFAFVAMIIIANNESGLQNNLCKHICNLDDHWFWFTQLIWQKWGPWIFHRPLWELRNGAENGTALKVWWQWRRDSNSILMYFLFPVVSRARMHTECLPDIEDYFLPASFIIPLLLQVSPIKLFKNVDQKALDPALCILSKMFPIGHMFSKG